jgi:hypothetical protein
MSDEEIVVVTPDEQVVEVVVDGEQGPPGPPGLNGPPGPSGALVKWYGNGPPGVIIGSSPGDFYLDLDTGDIYQLN